MSGPSGADSAAVPRPADGPIGTRYADPAAFVLDVRSAEEVALGTLRRAVNIPHTAVAEATDRLPASKETPILAYCRTGNRSGQAQVVLKELGYTDVLNGGGYGDLKHLDDPNAVSDGPIGTRYADPAAFVLDVRSAEEVALGTLRRAVNIPHTAVAEAGDRLPAAKETPILAFCRTGGRAGLAQATLKELGYTNVLNGGGYGDLRHLDNTPPSGQ